MLPENQKYNDKGRMKMERGGVKVLITILVILVIVAGGVLAYKITQSKKEETTKRYKYFKEMKDLLQ